MGLMADLDPKGEGDHSLPGKQRPCSGVEAGRCGTRVIWRKLDCLKPNLQQMQDPIRRKAPGTDVASCAGIGGLPAQPPGCEAISSEDIQGDEWAAYVMLDTYNSDERGITYRARALW